MSTIDPAAPIDVDLSGSNSGAWLVKMPKYLSQILSEHSSACTNGEVGRLIRKPAAAPSTTASSSTTGKVQEVTFCLSEEIIERIKKQNPYADFQMPPREHRFW